MAEDVSAALRQEMLATFAAKQAMDPQIQAFIKKLHIDKTATQTDVSAYAARLGELARDTIREVLTPDALPNETLYYNILRDTVGTLMKNAHSLVNRRAIEAQKVIDEAQGLGIQAVEAPYPQRRAHDLIYKAGAPEAGFDAKMRILDEPVVTLTQAFFDDHVRANAKERFRAGMAPKIVRTASWGCCKWCAAQAGTYDYEDVKDTGNNVFRRHQRCRCTVEYVCDGTRQDVWSKKMYAADGTTLQARAEYHTYTRRRSAAMAIGNNENPWPDAMQPIQGKELSDLRRYAAEKNITLRFFDSYDGDPELMREFIDSVDQVARDYPQVYKASKNGLQIFNDPSMDPDDFAMIAGRNGIRINTSAFRSRETLQSVYDKCVAEKKFVPGVAVQNIAYHEMGHVVCNTYQFSRTQAIEGLKMKNISNYAGKNASEGLAEAFSDVYSGRNSEEALTAKGRYDKLIIESEG